jgi:hypothetical protein
MTANPFERQSTGLTGPIDAETLHAITASANVLTRADGTPYIPRALVTDTAGTITFVTPSGVTFTDFPLIAGPNPIGGMNKVTAITTITKLYGVG